LILPAAAFWTFNPSPFPFFHAHHEGKFLFAFSALEFIVRHSPDPPFFFLKPRPFNAVAGVQTLPQKTGNFNLLA
jgi:hypothetical protein